ncbi:MAG: NADP-dependent malic enzyme [Gemmatimonadota bacterium]|jgi:malate dehydrogenase (oxaloacetate-decarboxylating)(NADP+)
MAISKKDALEYHTLGGKPGKIEVNSTKPMGTQRELSLAYSPGVADPCLEIEKNPDDAYLYTTKGNLVAVVSNGTAVLGLGDIGALASKPVMEGKGVLFKRFAGIDVFDIEISSKDPEDVIRACQLLEPTFGGINLEDIKAPECFHIETTLKKTMDIPVFHDDQHGTAIIGAAGLLNALELVGKKPDEVRVVFSGAGASAISSARHFTRLGIKPENMMMVDSKGVIFKGRTEGMNEFKEEWAVETDARTLDDAMKGADVFVGLSVAGMVSKDMVRSMADDPIIFGLANPVPEILPEEVAEVRDDAIMATGRSDYPNQVNNVLGFPFIFRGALDVRARAITPNMMLAATHALADLARQEVPESVMMAYGGEHIEFGRNYIIPKPFDPRVLFYVSPAVAKAAMEDGVSRIELDLDEYRDRLRASLGPAMEVMQRMVSLARRAPKRVVLPEGENNRIIRAAAKVVEEGVAKPILVGSPRRIAERAEALGVELDGVEVIHPPDEEEKREAYARALHGRRMRKGLTLAEARGQMFRALRFAGMMVREGDADALVAGIESNYPETIRPALQVVGRADEVQHVAGLYMIALPNKKLLFFADASVNIEPDTETLAEIAILSAGFVRELKIEPRVALLSFSNFGSAPHPFSRKVSDAVRRIKELDPELEVDGEMQADSALNFDLLQELFPFSDLTGPANILVFPNLSAANTAYKLMGEIGGAEIIGPILMGMRHPVHVLQRGSTVQDAVNLITIASVDAAERGRVKS